VLLLARICGANRQWQQGPGKVLPQVIRKLLESPEIPMRERVVGLLVLFYAQPVSRIALLTTNDVILENGTVLLRIGDPPTPAPDPLAGLLRELLAHRMSFRGPNAHTAWLFPGRRAGQPMRSQALGALLRQYGVAVQAGRTAALRQLVLQTPAPVIASMLGFHDTHTAWLVAEAGGTWSRYAPGDDHKR
jgi:integrase